MKKIRFLWFLFIFTIFVPTITAKELYEELNATKESKIIDETLNEYDIVISVPGEKEEIVTGYNFLFVMDASTSTNNYKWTNMRSSVLSAIEVLLPSVNPDENINKVGLMSFGISSHLNIPLTNDKSKFENLPTSNGNSLLSPGRSGTNNEAGLIGAYDYLNSLSKTLKKSKERTYVIYLTDGESNMNEEERYWMNYVKEGATFNNQKIDYLLRNYTLSIILSLEEKNDIKHDKIFDNLKKDIINLYQSKTNDTKETSLIKMLDYMTEDEDLIKILDNFIIKFLNHIGWDINTPISASKLEQLVTSKTWIDDNTLNNYVNNLVYIIMKSKGYNDLDNANRAVIAGMKLKEIANIYTIAYNYGSGLTADDAKKIMDPEYEGNEKKGYTKNTYDTHFSSQYYFTDISKINEVFTKLTSELIYINYTKAEVIDYTSKWVIPKDINNDGIFNEKDISVYNNGKLIKNPNITVKLLNNEEINATKDNQLLGNTSNKIYKITWYLTDEFLYTDNYTLTYKVNVDISEKDFISNKEYLANGDTTLTYDIIKITEQIDKDGNKNLKKETIKEKETYNIKVPTVKEKVSEVVVNQLGTLIVKYVDKNGNNLISPIKNEKTIGENYLTEEKNFDGYILSKVEGNVSGKFINGEIIVTYIYEKENTNIVEPPQTSTDKNYNIICIIPTIFLFIILILNKMLKAIK